MAKILSLKDKFGNDLNFGDCGDIWIPPFPRIMDFRQHIQNVRHMELRPDDVIIMGFPKTGTHWHLGILHMLFEGRADHYTTQEDEINEFLDACPTENLPPPVKPRVLFGHLRYSHLPKQVWEKNVKVIYLERNPKDTWVSMYNHVHGQVGKLAYEGSWEQFFELMMDMGFYYGNYFDYVLDWEENVAKDTRLTIMTSVFENLKKDPVGQIEKLDRFLGLNRGRELCEQIAEACKFATLKAIKDASLSQEMKKRMFKDNFHGLYRKGDVGDWKNWFTVAQNERFDFEYAKRMANSKLSYVFQ